MCITLDGTPGYRVSKAHPILGYKVFGVSVSSMCAGKRRIRLSSPVMWTIWSPNVIVRSKSHGNPRHGIHVFLTQVGAEAYRGPAPRRVVLPVLCWGTIHEGSEETRGKRYKTFTCTYCQIK